MAIPVPAVGDQISASWGDQVAAWGQAASTYTPALTATSVNPTLGTGGSITGKYSIVGNVLFADVQVIFGTSGAAAGTGTYAISLPVSTVVGVSGLLGFGHVKCAGTVRDDIQLIWATATTFNLYEVNAGALTVLTNAVPGAWTNNDLMRLNLRAFIA